jgi:protein-S-isoprenylcysteine O-methyltransferase Ste14
MVKKAPLPLSVLLVAVVLLGLTHVAVPIGRLIAFPYGLLGIVPLGLGVYLNLAADALLKRHQTTVKPFQVSASLVVGGVYDVTRHPMYLGFVLILLGIAILLGTATPFLVVMLFALVLDRTYIRTEEAMLRERFGSDWEGYARRVRRWV